MANSHDILHVLSVLCWPCHLHVQTLTLRSSFVGAPGILRDDGCTGLSGVYVIHCSVTGGPREFTVYAIALDACASCIVHNADTRPHLFLLAIKVNV